MGNLFTNINPFMPGGTKGHKYLKIFLILYKLMLTLGIKGLIALVKFLLESNPNNISLYSNLLSVSSISPEVLSTLIDNVPTNLVVAHICKERSKHQVKKKSNSREAQLL